MIVEEPLAEPRSANYSFSQSMSLFLPQLYGTATAKQLGIRVIGVRDQICNIVWFPVVWGHIQFVILAHSDELGHKKIITDINGYQELAYSIYKKKPFIVGPVMD